MKYIDAEKLIAEIERLHKAHSGKYGCDEVGLNLEYLEDFISSLQQEQPEVYLEKAARNVYESWMGGTMDDVRRDMVELGKVLNARKEK